MRTAIYARGSTTDGRQGTENQLVELRSFAKTQGWEIAAEYIDHESGGLAARAEFRHMFADVDQRKFDLVLVWALDRSVFNVKPLAARETSVSTGLEKSIEHTAPVRPMVASYVPVCSFISPTASTVGMMTARFVASVTGIPSMK
jgi:hypothetical protein